jgi:hypothetical protein
VSNDSEVTSRQQSEIHRNLRLEALEEGSKLYEEEWARNNNRSSSSSVGKKEKRSLVLVESMERAARKIDSERGMTKNKESRSVRKLASERLRNRSNDYAAAIGIDNSIANNLAFAKDISFHPPPPPLDPPVVESEYVEFERKKQWEAFFEQQAMQDEATRVHAREWQLYYEQIAPK